MRISFRSLSGALWRVRAKVFAPRNILCRLLWHIKFVIWIILLFVSLIRTKKENFSLHSYSWAYSFCAVLGPCKQKKYSTLKKGYEGSNRLFKKIHHFRDPTLGTLGELLVGKLRMLKVLESLICTWARLKLVSSHYLCRSRAHAIAYFEDILGNNGGGRARMEGAKKRSGNTVHPPRSA